MTPDSSLFRVTKQIVSSTLIVASSEEHAKSIAKKLPIEAFADVEIRCRAIEIRSAGAIPQSWRGALPWVDPGRTHLYGEPTCEEVIQYAKSQRRAMKRFRSSR
jgi:hypothetical protein